MRAKSCVSRVGARMLRALCVVLPASLALLGAGGTTPRDESIRFVREGSEVGRFAKPALRAECAVREVRVPRDPYYEREKRYLACPLEEILASGFGLGPEELRNASFFLRAADGYVRTAEGKQLLEGGAFLAIADADETRPGEPFRARWLPIDRRGVDPGPYYLIWAGAGQGDPHRYPWPFQLIEIEIAPFDKQFPHTLPAGLPSGQAAWRGFEIFRRECLSCHSINGEGGKVGPDLNVPQSIVEYRPKEQIRAYIRDPRSFRYTTMPAHPHLSELDLDDLLAYFGAMRDRKFDANEPRP